MSAVTADVQRDDRRWRVAQPSVCLTIAIVIAWHLVLAAVCGWALFNIAGAVWQLESLPRTRTGIGATVGLVLNLMAVVLLWRGSRRGRTTSFVVNYLGLVFANLIDFDMLNGHRRDPAGYARALEGADRFLGELARRLGESDLLIVTADNGNDPTFRGTDHTREYVPLVRSDCRRCGRNESMNGGRLPAGATGVVGGGEIVSVTTRAESDHLVTSKEGNRYVFLNAEGRVVVDKQAMRAFRLREQIHPAPGGSQRQRVRITVRRWRPCH